MKLKISFITLSPMPIQFFVQQLVNRPIVSAAYFLIMFPCPLRVFWQTRCIQNYILEQLRSLMNQQVNQEVFDLTYSF